MNRRTAKLALFALLGTLFLLPSLRAQDDEEKADGVASIKTLDVVEEEGVTHIFLVGEADLPNGTRLACSVSFLGSEGPTVKAEVRGKRFEAEFPITADIVPGPYKMHVTFSLRDQRRRLRKELADVSVDLTRKFTMGDASQFEAEKKKIQVHYFHVLELMRNAFVPLNSQGTYTGDAIRVLNLKKAEKEKIDQTFRSWEMASRQYWEDLYVKQARLEMVRMRKRLFMTPYPEVETAIAKLMATMERWYAGLVVDIYEAADRTPPAEMKSLYVQHPKRIAPQIQKQAEEISKMLGAPMADWFGVDLNQAERGLIKGNFYESYVAKFSVRKTDDWEFDLTPMSPLIRVRIRPKDNEIRSGTVVAVEIQDYPISESYEDLTKFTIRAAENRWPGFKRLEGEEIKVSDETMKENDGLRPGYEQTFETTATRKGVRRVYICYKYDLYCRWAKRTYGLMCITPEEHYDKVKDDWKKMAESFRVLDHPDYREERLKELRKQKQEQEEDSNEESEKKQSSDDQGK